MISRDPVRASAEDIYSIYAEVERFAVLVLVLNQFYLPKASLLGFGVEYSLTVQEARSNLVQRLLSVPMRIPKSWLMDPELHFGKPIIPDLCGLLEDYITSKAEVE